MIAGSSASGLHDCLVNWNTACLLSVPTDHLVATLVPALGLARVRAQRTTEPEFTALIPATHPTDEETETRKVKLFAYLSVIVTVNSR